ncbi:hypothetical protein CMV_010729 [Castanea mollissima]|uniref:Uncharacterized protein n=1 Tax=Castanea mollissima TaxID=60419 RepID=A0A8J4RMH9_9ROSI|nr:hypothetical protein CMV_010729 [Castanea mollissima]
MSDHSMTKPSPSPPYLEVHHMAHLPVAMVARSNHNNNNNGECGGRLSQDNVLTYYKIHGPDKIVFNQGTEPIQSHRKESLRRISRHRNGASLPQQNLPRKPLCEIHLKVVLTTFIVI